MQYLMLGTLLKLSHLIFITLQRDRHYYCLHFIEENIRLREIKRPFPCDIKLGAWLTSRSMRYSSLLCSADPGDFQFHQRHRINMHETTNTSENTRTYDPAPGTSLPLTHPSPLCSLLSSHTEFLAVPAVCWACTCPGAFALAVPATIALISLSSVLRCYFLRETFPDHHMWSNILWQTFWPYPALFSLFYHYPTWY